MTGAVVWNAWGDGRDCAVADEGCAFRPCLWVAENKGSFQVGRGYTSYHRHPWLECWMRHEHGCPRPRPEPEPERARCCIAPDFPDARKSGARTQTCRTCRTRMGGMRLALCRTLERHPAVPCAHEVVDAENWACEPAWHCRQCGCWWEVKPQPHQPGEALAAFSEGRFAAWKARMEAR